MVNKDEKINIISRSDSRTLHNVTVLGLLEFTSNNNKERF